ncbi:MAG: spore germination protein [Clostridia bacterium]|nr:spore germination protein [Clostridia bacterium]
MRWRHRCNGRVEGRRFLLLRLLEGCEFYTLISTKKWAMRPVQEPPTSAVVKGPREGFVEDFLTNISMVKRRLKTPSLKFSMLKIGRLTNTSVAVVYLDGIADKKVVDSIKSKLSAIDIDGIIDSAYLREHLKGRQFSIFKQIGDTEKPDVLTAKLLEGRVGIIVEGSPIVLTLPYLLIEDLQSADDYYTIPFNATFIRTIRYISVMLGVFMPGFYVATQLFHLQFIPLRFTLTIASSVKGIPLSPNLEMLFTLFVFELLNEASIRMPKYVGMALSVVGALVLGETAVNAGLISMPTILIMALSGIAVYTVPDQRNTLSILRLFILLLSGAFGIIGLILGALVLAVYLTTLSNYDIPYLAPFAPFVKNDIKDGLLKSPAVITNQRPQSFNNKNKRRLS